MSYHLLVIPALYILAMLGIGVYYSDDASSDEGFLVANQRIGSVIGGGALAVTFVSTSSLLGLVSAGYRLGIGFHAFAAVGSVVAFVFAMFFVAPQIRSLDVSTLPEYFEVRFGERSKRLSALIVALIMVIYLIAQVRGGALVAEYILDITYVEGVLLAGSIFTLYTLLGGMYAITVTSFIQACIMILSVTLVAVAGFSEIGGAGAFFQQVSSEASFYFTGAGHAGFGYAISFGILMFLAILSSPHVVFRYFASKDVETARSTASMATLFTGVFYLVVAFVPAFVIFLVSSVTNPDQAFLELSQVLYQNSPFVLGLIFASILAAAMSTSDAMLMNAATSVVYDLGDPWFDEGQDRTSYVRAVTLLIGVVVVALTISPPGLILAIVVLALSLFVGAFFAPLMLGLWMEDRSDAAAVAGMLCGVVTVAVTHPTTPLIKVPQDPYAAILGVTASTIAFLAVNQFADTSPKASSQPTTQTD